MRILGRMRSHFDFRVWVLITSILVFVEGHAAQDRFVDGDRAGPGSVEAVANADVRFFVSWMGEPTLEIRSKDSDFYRDVPVFSSSWTSSVDIPFGEELTFELGSLSVVSRLPAVDEIGEEDGPGAQAAFDSVIVGNDESDLEVLFFHQFLNGGDSPIRIVNASGSELSVQLENSAFQFKKGSVFYPDIRRQSSSFTILDMSDRVVWETSGFILDSDEKVSIVLLPPLDSKSFRLQRVLIFEARESE